MTTKRLTLATVRTELRAIGVVITTTDSEYRVNYRNGREATAYYTNDLADALATGKAMIAQVGG